MRVMKILDLFILVFPKLYLMEKCYQLWETAVEEFPWPNDFGKLWAKGREHIFLIYAFHNV